MPELRIRQRNQGRVSGRLSEPWLIRNEAQTAPGCNWHPSTSRNLSRKHTGSGRICSRFSQSKPLPRRGIKDRDRHGCPLVVVFQSTVKEAHAIDVLRIRRQPRTTYRGETGSGSGKPKNQLFVGAFVARERERALAESGSPWTNGVSPTLSLVEWQRPLAHPLRLLRFSDFVSRDSFRFPGFFS